MTSCFRMMENILHTQPQQQPQPAFYGNGFPQMSSQSVLPNFYVHENQRNRRQNFNMPTGFTQLLEAEHDN